VLSALAPFLRAVKNTDPSDAVTGWQFHSRYFSSQIFFTLGRSDGTLRHFVAKFPKAARGRGHSQLPGRLPEDVGLAAEEYRAFRGLSESWPKDHSDFVQPLFYDPSSGFLVFPFVAGQDLYVPSLARQLVFGRLPIRFMHDVGRLGSSLGAYHARSANPGTFFPDKVLARIEKAGHEFDAPLPGWLRGEGKRSASVVPGIRGFEVRNARSGADRIWLFDPGRLRDEPAEADVARFLVSLKILTWGTVYFALPVATQEIEQAFLTGYRQHRTPDPALLRLFLLRELSWNWTECVEVIKLKRLPPAAQHMLTTAYVHPGFRRHWRSLVAD
jgi:hypothetical protein